MSGRRRGVFKTKKFPKMPCSGGQQAVPLSFLQDQKFFNISTAQLFCSRVKNKYCSMKETDRFAPSMRIGRFQANNHLNAKPWLMRQSLRMNSEQRLFVFFYFQCFSKRLLQGKKNKESIVLYFTGMQPEYYNAEEMIV